MGFLPEDYKVPSGGSSYLKLAIGKNTFRILSDPIVGWEYWVEEDGKRKPIRVRTAKDIPVAISNSAEQDSKPKHFWAMFVWNRETEVIQVLQITQATIQTGIKALVDEEDWGNPREYDLTVTREGEGLDTKYTVTPKPVKELDKEIVSLWKESEKEYDLNRLYDGGNPFISEGIDIDDIL